MSDALKSFETRAFDSAGEAVAAASGIYNAHVAYLRESFDLFTKNKLPAGKIRACYPFVRIEAGSARRQQDSRLSYGFVQGAGLYETTLTRPDIFAHYYEEQIGLLLKNHGGSVEIGVSDTPVPLHFALGEDFHLEKDLSPEQIRALPGLFDQPDLDILDDQIPNGTYTPGKGPMPLALFTAPRVDLSLLRLKHYTGTKAGDFQNYVIFTNYQFYIDEFVKIGEKLAGLPDYTGFTKPAEGARLPQMPAYHLKRADGSGITMVNIGVGPSNAKTITDHVAVLRPHAWLMLGHCAGLRNSQRLGDYVLAHGYLREDNVLYHDLNPTIPLPALSEIQLSLEQAVSEITGLEGYEKKKILRTGTVATVDDRNWELRASVRQNIRFSQSRAIALDMESGTVAANGFRFRVPYGTLLCVSDKPLHGQLKLPGMADSFYRERVVQHLQIGLRAMEILREIGPEKLHSRKLRSFNEVAFQ
ncbi:MAG: AMP nucleosidase [Rhodospirillales bacterium]|nr:AMP nucleosidase [Alphaproteobacteria bacterium]USO03114.1 MAG: AMP nucleosidase [Rhodospirillales bacterium]